MRQTENLASSLEPINIQQIAAEGLSLFFRAKPLVKAATAEPITKAFAIVF
jgi:hypothetical protein